MPLEPDSPDDNPYQSTVWQTEGGSLLEMMIDTASWSDVDMEAVRTRFCIAADMTCAHLGQPVVSVGALLCDDQRMRQLNSQFRGKDSTTNVLSFPDEMPEDETPESPDMTPRLIGEMALAHGRLVAEAEDDGKSLDDHLTHLFVHGLAHLFGLDHETDADAQAMEAAETAILASLGIADPYGNMTGAPGETEPASGADSTGVTDSTGGTNITGPSEGRKRAAS